MSERTYMRSKVRNALQTLLLMGGMLVLMLLLNALVAGPQGTSFLIVFLVVLLLFSPRISPQLILRLYKASPLHPSAAPELMEVVQELSRRAGLPKAPQLYYIPSRIVNAFALGTRSSSAIGLTDGLLRSLDARELTGVLAHEISHVRKNDIWVMGLADIISRLTGIFAFFGQVLLFFSLVMLPFGQGVPWLAILLLIAAPSLTALLQLALSRTREFDADLDAVALTRDPRGMASALEKMERLEAGMFERIFLPGRRIPDPSILRTHPDTKERIRRLLELEGHLPGEDRPPLPHPGYADPHVPRWHASGLWY